MNREKGGGGNQKKGEKKKRYATLTCLKQNDQMYLKCRYFCKKRHTSMEKGKEKKRGKKDMRLSHTYVRMIECI